MAIGRSGKAVVRVWNTRESLGYKESTGHAYITTKRVYTAGRAFDRATLEDVSAKAVRRVRRVDLLTYDDSLNVPGGKL